MLFCRLFVKDVDEVPSISVLIRFESSAVIRTLKFGHTYNISVSTSTVLHFTATTILWFGNTSPKNYVIVKAGTVGNLFEQLLLEDVIMTSKYISLSFRSIYL